MTAQPPKPPSELRRSGRALWRDVMDQFELSEHETTLLRECCRTVDGIDRLQAAVDAEGVMAESSQGARVHPALVELRQQRLALARMFAALQLPAGEDSTERTQRRSGVRGVYSIGGAS